MPGISVHVVDVTRGLPAQGMRVRVFRLDGTRRISVGEGQIGIDGVLAHPMNAGNGVSPGIHDVELDVGEFYRAAGVAVGSPAFQETAVYRFCVVDAAEHYHLPVKLSPWGLAIWRGR